MYAYLVVYSGHHQKALKSAQWHICYGLSTYWVSYYEKLKKRKAEKRAKRRYDKIKWRKVARIAYELYLSNLGQDICEMYQNGAELGIQKCNPEAKHVRADAAADESL